LSKNEIVKKNDFEIGKVVSSLHDIMVEVCKQRPNAENVHAACNCAGKILDFMNFNLELKKFKLNEKKMD
jgi:hypothetical protein